MRSARELLKLQFGDEALARPVAIKISAYGAHGKVLPHFKRPMSHYKASGDLKQSAPDYLTTTPDVDNVTKFVLDALQPAVLKDDKFVVLRCLCDHLARRSSIKSLKSWLYFPVVHVCFDRTLSDLPRFALR